MIGHNAHLLLTSLVTFLVSTSPPASASPVSQPLVRRQATQDDSNPSPTPSTQAVIFVDVQQPSNSSSSSSSAQSTPAPRVNVAAVVTGTLAVVALIVIAALFVRALLRRRQRQRGGVPEIGTFSSTLKKDAHLNNNSKSLGGSDWWKVSWRGSGIPTDLSKLRLMLTSFSLTGRQTRGADQSFPTSQSADATAPTTMLQMDLAQSVSAEEEMRVAELKPLLEPLVKSTRRFRARQGYRAKRIDELTFQAGEEILLYALFDDGWGYGEIVTDSTSSPPRKGVLPIVALTPEPVEPVDQKPAQESITEKESDEVSTKEAETAHPEEQKEEEKHEQQQEQQEQPEEQKQDEQQQELPQETQNQQQEQQQQQQQQQPSEPTQQSETPEPQEHHQVLELREDSRSASSSNDASISSVHRMPPLQISRMQSFARRGSLFARTAEKEVLSIDQASEDNLELQYLTARIPYPEYLSAVRMRSREKKRQEHINELRRKLSNPMLQMSPTERKVYEQQLEILEKGDVETINRGSM
ncbi:hypothetical protein HK102_009675, partial [Quaeritorhiza haematococci]